MKKISLIFIIIITTSVFAQYRDNGLDKPSVKEGIVVQSSQYAFGFLNSENFLMQHSFSLSYTSFGGNGISLGTYTNSMYYKLMNNLNVQMDVSMIFSPYSSFGKSFQDDINGIYISRAAVTYTPFKDMNISIQYRSLPYGSYYSNPFYGRYNGFSNNPFKEDDH